MGHPLKDWWDLIIVRKTLTLRITKNTYKQNLHLHFITTNKLCLNTLVYWVEEEANQKSKIAKSSLQLQCNSSVNEINKCLVLTSIKVEEANKSSVSVCITSETVIVGIRACKNSAKWSKTSLLLLICFVLFNSEKFIDWPVQYIVNHEWIEPSTKLV